MWFIRVEFFLGLLVIFRDLNFVLRIIYENIVYFFFLDRENNLIYLEDNVVYVLSEVGCLKYN